MQCPAAKDAAGAGRIVQMKMFEEAEVSADLDARLRAAGLDPSDALVQTVKTIVSGYYAERTAEVLTKVRDVLDKFGAGELH
jgi:hypothetical protein